MADLPPYPDSNDDTGGDTGVGPDRGSTTSTPLWVKVFGVIIIVLVLVFVILQFTGGGGHGPGRHTPGGDTPSTEQFDGSGVHTPPIEHGVQQP